MLEAINFNKYQNVTFRGNTSSNMSKEIAVNLESFKNKMLADEQITNGYIHPEIKNAIESKIAMLKRKASNVNPNKENYLLKPLQEAIKGKYDITETYLALGEFEKRLSNI